ncbi:SMI1/KNR4 family protein [Pedobacter aquatilis]|uniref:SMI1/KNR4 family protein n=1 Tax=Pedobacter aquatilis TaxID=351343 RepID=UPI00292D826B|nr:SMI1/KNR4 family protein [Pedobacter aquatilis]
MNRFDSIIELINKNQSIANFAEYGEGTSQELIDQAQEKLDVHFPPSYIWWLKNYAGGEIYGDEIFSVYSTLGSMPGGDIVYINELDRKNSILNKHQLSIMSTDQGETFYFDLEQKDDLGESPIYTLSNSKKYADDFLDFLKKQIGTNY